MKYWQRNGSFTFLPEVKVDLLIDSAMVPMQIINCDDVVGITYRISWIYYSVDQHCCSDYQAFLVLGVILLGLAYRFRQA